MDNTPFVIERTYNAPVESVWKALTDKNEMKQWYFDLAEFKPEVGFEFQFTAKGKDGKEFIHLCKVTDVVKGQKLSYSWRYKGYEGNSLVTFELFKEGNQTRLKLTHAGLETFPASEDFARKNFVEGWTYITGTSLKQYLEKMLSQTVTT
ncbi:SRPBCC family protein [Ohtaekwangia sp.]|uniref:SRPBCC family protein n=1 Tax=Ohtaekwangia sp. TaxID=2066019 RepID=UPI002F92E58D